MAGHGDERVDVDEFVNRVRAAVFANQGDVAPPPASKPTTAPNKNAVAQVLDGARKLLGAGVKAIPEKRRKGMKRRVRKYLEGYTELQLRRELKALREELRAHAQGAVDFASDRLSHQIQAAVRRTSDEQGRLVRELTEQNAEIARLRAELVTVRDTTSALADAARAELENRRRDAALVASVKASISLQEQRLSLLLEEVRKRSAGALDADAARVAESESAHMLDALYAHLEAAFRGTREDIKSRVVVHLDAVRDAGAGTADRPILDLGSGRGEWLEALRDAGLEAKGIDLNRVFLEECRALGLEVDESDCVDALRARADGSLGAVTAIHLVEHLPLEALIAVLDESLRTLRSGGVLVLETPNPRNLIVGACSFYLDPTHRNPLHPELLRFLVEARGFVRAGIRPLHPVPKEHHYREDGNFITPRLNEYLYGPQDYAIVAYRP